jgi:prolipoprotein diacylglyceryltransferase
LHFHPWLHPVFEALAYSGGFWSYLALKKRRGDPLPAEQRLTVITAAAVGAALGSKLLALFEEPALTLAHLKDPRLWMGGKTVVGGLVGGWLAVELAKKLIGVKTSTGDLFAIPLCAGIIIGRIGCFMAGIADHTYGNPTNLPWGVDLGDGISRHPTQIYEIVFLLGLAGFIHWRSLRPHRVGDLFKYFMLGYLGLRLAIDFIKPIPAVWLGLSSIQWVCVGALLWNMAQGLVHPVGATHASPFNEPHSMLSGNQADEKI